MSSIKKERALINWREQEGELLEIMHFLLLPEGQFETISSSDKRDNLESEIRFYTHTKRGERVLLNPPRHLV